MFKTLIEMQTHSLLFVANIAVPEFAHGKTYVYKYEALLMGGLPEEGLARAGMKVKSKVLISEAAADTYMLKVISSNLY